MSDVETGQPFDPREYLRPLWRRLWLIVAIAVVATAATYVYSESQPDRYTASTKVFLTTTQVDELLSGGAELAADDRTNQTLAALLTSRAVAEEAAKRMDYRGDPGDLLADVDVIPASGADFVTIEAERGSAREAAALANAFAGAFIASRRASAREEARSTRAVAERRLNRLQREGGNRDAVRSLRSRIQRLKVIETLPTGGVEQVDPARPPGVPSSPRPKRNATFALVIALAFGAALALALERFDRRIKRIDDVEPLYGAPVLGVVPRLRRSRDGRLDLTPAGQEAFRMLRSNAQLADLDGEISTLLVTSAIAQEGKSTVVRNLAFAYQETGLRVAVVELDLHRPRLSELFGINREPGLTNVLLGDNGVGDALQHVIVGAGGHTAVVDHYGTGSRTPGSNGFDSMPVDNGSLSVLTSGSISSNPAAILGAQRVHDLLDKVKADHDLVLIDSPPLLAVGDTLPLLSAVDGVLVVARADLTTQEAAKRLTGAIERAPQVRVIGVVVNDVQREQAGYLSYYQSH